MYYIRSMKKTLSYLLTILIITPFLWGCSSSKVYQLMSGGQVVNQNYKAIVPFEMRMGLIIVKVKIEGEEYDFLFDTGAPNVVSYELSEKLQLKPVGKTYTRGSQGQRNKVDYANLQKITIGEISYTETTAAIMNLKKAVVLDCMELDGILGANVMRNSIWQINYQKQQLTLTNSTDSLSFSNHLDTIPFIPQHTGTPKIKIQVGPVIQSGITIDTGASGHIDLNYNTYKKTKTRLPNMPKTTGYGSSSSGIYGIGEPDTLVYFKPDSIQIGTVQLQNQICYASMGRTSSTLGTRFLENYIITLDWGRNQMVLDSVSKYDNSELKHLGFKPKFIDNSLRVGFLFTESHTGSNQMQLDDHILKIDSNDFTVITQQDFCELILDTAENKNEVRNIQFERDSIIHSITLKESVLLK